MGHRGMASFLPFLWCSHWWGPWSVLLEVSLLYNLTPSYAQNTDAAPTAWASRCIRNFFLSHGLPWWEFLSRCVTQICLSLASSYCCLLHLLQVPTAEWGFVQCANSKPSPQFRPGIHAFLFAICASWGTFSYGNFLLWQCLEIFHCIL